jgi:hypothetical protein
MDFMAEIEDVASRFRAGEAEVARTFFSQPRPLEQHLYWLRIQVARELRNLREISHGELTELVDKVDRGVTREKIVAELREHYYETRHYAMLANLLEGIGAVNGLADLDAERGKPMVRLHRQEQKRCREWTRYRRCIALQGPSIAAAPVRPTALLDCWQCLKNSWPRSGRSSSTTRWPTAKPWKSAIRFTIGEDRGGRQDCFGIVREYSTILERAQLSVWLSAPRRTDQAIARGEIEPATLDAGAAYVGAITRTVVGRYRAAGKP